MWNEIKGRPSLILLFSTIIGILLFRYTNLIFFPLLILALVFLFIKEKLTLVLMVILLSSWWTTKNYNRYMVSIKSIEEISGSTVNITCSIKDISKYRLKVKNVILNNKRYYGILDVKIKDNIYQHEDKLYIIGKVYPSRITNISERRFQERVIGTVYPSKIEILSRQNFSLRRFLYNVKSRIKSRASVYLDDEEAELIMTMVLGISEELPYEIYKKFKVTGLIHTLVVSGTQVSIITSSIMPFLSGLWLILLFPLIVLYAFITGLEISVVRASIMMGINILAHVIYEDYDPPSSLAFSGLLILAFDPLSLFGSSFQLSFLATFSLVCISPYIRIRKLNFVMPTLIVQGILAPLLLYKNGSLPLISFPINIILSPLISLLTIGGFILSLSTFTLPLVTQLISIIIKPITYLLLRIVTLGNSITYEIVYNPSIIELVSMYIIIGGLIYIGYTRLYKDNK
ncbi:MAG: ComEC/Rec2 family competence protein [bacterium]|nr:ComEC/Rec2 family competence protein [bacterium]